MQTKTLGPRPIYGDVPKHLIAPLHALADCKTGIDALDKTDDLSDDDLCLVAEFMAHRDFFRPVVVRTILASAFNSGMIDVLGYQRTKMATSRFYPINISQDERYHHATHAPFLDFLETHYGIAHPREAIGGLDPHVEQASRPAA